jgi:hypothetical protein
MSRSTTISALSDQELLFRIKDNSDYLGIVYKKCKPNCIVLCEK